MNSVLLRDSDVVFFATEMVKSFFFFFFLEDHSGMLFCIFAPASKIGECYLRHWRFCYLQSFISGFYCYLKRIQVAVADL